MTLVVGVSAGSGCRFAHDNLLARPPADARRLLSESSASERRSRVSAEIR